MESVWDYPRPPRVEASDRRIRVVHAGAVIADTAGALRVLETSQAPAWYVPPGDVDAALLVATPTLTFCEWKGLATHWAVQVGDATVADAAWSYEQPIVPYTAIAGYLAFYPARVDECWVDDERATAMPGQVYGGWITSEVSGPFKGGPGTAHW
ncbi:MAG: DUF427 domain-containing protein [Acidobacteria bacterium]|nr:DUF427 domain-containing protein [Acidobacteriota bacterium]